MSIDHVLEFLQIVRCSSLGDAVIYFLNLEAEDALACISELYCGLLQ